VFRNRRSVCCLKGTDYGLGECKPHGRRIAEVAEVINGINYSLRYSTGVSAG
jgi:hypothetical protein